jgi:hypothetical protein
VNRSLLAIASALLVAPALFATGAQACISCSYTPEVVKGSQTSDAPRYYAREHVYAVERSAPVKKRAVAERSVAKNLDTAEDAPAKVETKQAKNENSSISSAADVATAEPAKVEPKAARNENSSISVSKPGAPEKVAAADPVPAKEVSGKATDCKKFFATVGLTLSVPCE